MGIFNDVRYAVRSWRQAPGTALAVVVSLAFGLSANLTIFSWLDALVSRPLSGVPAQHRLVVVDGRSASGRDQRLSYPEVRDLSRELTQIDGLAAYTYQSFGLSTGDHAERVWGQLVTANFFAVLRVRPILGRTFLASEEPAGAGPVAIISESLWRRRFNGAATAIGQTIQINGQRVTIIGVAPPAFHGVAVGLLLDIWIPVGMQPLLGGGQPNRLSARDVRWLGAYARLRDPATPAALRNELQTLGARLGKMHRESETTSFTATTLSDAPWGGTNVVRPILRVLAVLVSLLLIVTVANVTSLLLVRAVGRRREVAARVALGATRYRLARQLFTENLAVGVIAAVVAVIASLSSTRLFTALLPPTGFPIGFDIAVDPWWLATSTLLAVGTIILVGIAPLLHAITTPLVTVLREEAANIIGEPRRGTLRRLLIGTQVALSVVMLTVSGTLVNALAHSRAVDPGFDPGAVLLAAIDLSQAGYSPARGMAGLRRLHAELVALPGVESVSFAQRVPLDFGGRGLVQASIDGYTPARGEEVSLALNHVGPDYLRTLKIPLVSGREFGLEDDESGERVAIVNERAAAMYWGAGNALNKRIALNGANVRVVGVFADIRQDGLTQPPPAAVLVPVLQAYRPAVVLHVSGAGDPASLAAPVRELIARLDPTLAVYDIRTMAAHMEVPTFSYRLGSTLSLALGLMTLMLAGLGLYASVSRDISGRRTEMGVRMALGATRVELIRFMCSHAIGTVAAGMVVGLAAAIATATTLGEMIEGAGSADASLYLIGAAVTLTACASAIVVPMKTALLMTPVGALRGR